MLAMCSSNKDLRTSLSRDSQACQRSSFFINSHALSQDIKGSVIASIKRALKDSFLANSGTGKRNQSENQKELKVRLCHILLFYSPNLLIASFSKSLAVPTANGSISLMSPRSVSLGLSIFNGQKKKS